MGLDVYLYTHAVPCTAEETAQIMQADECDRPQVACDLDLVWIEREDFPQRCADLPALAYRCVGMEHIGSWGYAHYGQWREHLAAKVCPQLLSKHTDGRMTLHRAWTCWRAKEAKGEQPLERFWQLLHFTDSNGTLGPSVCRALAEDFDALRDWQLAEWRLFRERCGWKRPTDFYKEWREAFRAAGASNGFVLFSG